MPTHKVTDETFENEVLNARLPVVVDFWAEWCGPCLSMAPLLEEIADELYESVIIVKLDVDSNPKSAETYDIHSVPAFIIFKNGIPLDNDIGLMPKDIFKNWILASI